MRIPSSSLGIAALLAATSAWGAMFLVSKDVLRHVDPFWFTLIRYSLSALIFAALLAPRGAAPWRKLRSHAGPLALRGVTGFGVFSVMLLTGLAHSVPSHGAIIMATTPISTQLLRWVLDGVRPTRTTLLSSALALAGVVVVSGVLAPSSGDAASTAWGDAIAFAGTLGWVWYTRGATQFAGQLDVVEYTGLTVLAAWPLLVLGALGASAIGLAEVPQVRGAAAVVACAAVRGAGSFGLCRAGLQLRGAHAGDGDGDGVHQLRAGVGAADERGDGEAAFGERAAGDGDGGGGVVDSHGGEPVGGGGCAGAGQGACRWGVQRAS